MTDDIKRIPYGVSDFKQLRQNNFYYVDKTMFIPRLEWAGNFLFFIRPRRFGKSLFLNMLAAYYDIEGADEWDRLFGGLYIHEHPTREKGLYQVLRLDFSQAGGTMDTLYDNFSTYCCAQLDAFIRRYGHLYDPGFKEEILAMKGYGAKLDNICAMARQKGHRLYLIVDEYDNFTNTVLSEYDERVYHSLTHATGFYRDLFKKFKPNFDRILMLGVSPVTMDDLTSGYNIATSITMNPRFNMMLGFSEDEVRQIIGYYREAGLIGRTEDEIVEAMRPWYDNYCFAKASLHRDPKMFNSDMVLYYLNSLVDTGEEPEEMTDPNTKTDYKKMRRLISLDGTGTYRADMINRIAEQGYVLGTVDESFPAERLIDRELFVSLLYYYGMLTIGDSVGALLKLIIPNNNVRRQYYDYLLEEYRRICPVDTSPLGDAFDRAAIDGDWRPLLDFIGRQYRDTTAIRSLIEGERNLQGFMNAYLTLTPYWMTQPEVELDHGYCDFFLMPELDRYPMVRHSYILELKYLRQEATEGEASAQWQEAVAQIRRYAQGRMVRLLQRTTQLHLLVAQVRGYTWERVEEIAAD